MASLPILQVRREVTDSDLLRLFHRANSTWVEAVAEGTLLDCGTAYANAELASVWDANNVRDAALPEGTGPAAAVDEVAAHYAARGSRCAYWVMNPSAPDAQTRGLAEYLLANGHHVVGDDILYLRKVPARVATAAAGLMIIPARASYKHARQLAAEGLEGPGADQRIEGRIQHLDDPHYDALLAIQGDRAIAHIGVLAVGEIGLIQGVYVSPDFRRRGIGRTLMGRAVEICARSFFMHVILSTEPGNVAAQGLYAELGFAKIGELTRYCAAGVS
jgi:ribosomal protein S18 acetylase RimI-like enzyme